MKRLVYSPKVQAWISGTEGVVDVSPYIVSGMIHRKVNQVSTASLVMRNPVSQVGNYVGTLFTEFRRSDGTIGPLFHPMDPIIITMQRVENHPIQVFTGYLDKAPYLQLYPGLCQVDASCTLKRLLYTQFDAALPFVQYFLSLFGWVPDGNTGIMQPTAETDRLKVFAGQIQNQFNDGSIGGLLYAVLLYIGGWDPTTIFIEKLPDNIKSYAVSLFNRIQADIGDSENIFQDLIKQILGSSSLGSGSPSSANGTGGGTVHSPLLNANQNSFASELSKQTGLDPNVVAAWVLSEEPASATAAPNGANNWLNIGDTGSGNYGGTASVWADPVTAGNFTAKWLSGASLPGYGVASAGIQNVIKSASKNAQAQIQALQQSGWAASGYPSLPSVYSSIVKAGGQSTNPLGSVQSSTLAIGKNPLGSSPTQTSNQGTGGTTASISGTSPGGAQGSPGSQSNNTRYNVIVEAANAINGKAFPYVWGGGHGSPGIPTGGGFDCSGVVSAVLFAAGLTTSSFATGDEVSTLGSNIATGIDTGQNAVNIFVRLASPDHTFMQIGGRYFGTWSNGTSTAGGGGWLADGSPSGYTAYHVPQNLLAQTTANALPAAAGGPGGSATLPGGGSGNQATTTSGTADAFSTMINLPSVFQSAEAVAFTGKRSFIADSPLFPFIEQLAQASMRNFMSMPNGNFFAFFPDYFGLFGRNYYWTVSDLELIDGRIDLSDDPLTTHVAIAGDVTQYSGQVNVFDLLLTAGIFDIFDAFALGYVSGADTLVDVTLNAPNPSKGALKQDRNSALEFLKRYGARTYVEEIPAIRSPFFELFYSFQKFMMLWSKQFQTTFELTFMPELFPGGLVGFPDHNLQLYVEEVTHSFDYIQGFQTIANFSSPSKLNDQSRTNLREGLTRVVSTTSK